MKRGDVDRIGEHGQRAADLVRTLGMAALENGAAWASPLRSSVGPGPKNGVSDPTGTAATAEPDRTVTALGELEADLRAWHDLSLRIEARIRWMTTDARIENQRAGIGACESCGRYCDASSDALRLRAGVCNACRMREARRAS